MRMKLWLCFSSSGKALSIALCGDLTAARPYAGDGAFAIDAALRDTAEQARHLCVAAPARKHLRGFVVVGREARVRALCEKQLHDIGVHGIGARREHERRIAAAVPAVHVRAAIEQHLHRFGVPRAGGVAERRLTKLASHVGVGALLEEQLNGARAAVGRRCHERRRARAILCVDQRALVEQQTHRIDVAAKRGPAERRQPVERRDVRIAAVVEQEPQHRIARSRGAMPDTQACVLRPA